MLGKIVNGNDGSFCKGVVVGKDGDDMVVGEFLVLDSWVVDCGIYDDEFVVF